MTSKKLITPAAYEPIPLSEAKLHLYLETSPPTSHPDDAMILAFIQAAREWAEGFQNRAFVTQTWDLYLNRFPDRHERYIELPLPPLQYLISLSYDDGSAVQTVSFLDPSGTALMETDDYIVDETMEPGRLCLKHGSAWPSAIHQAKSVQIRFVAGYGDPENVPENVKAAIKLKLADLYENRGDAEPGSNYEMAAKSLLWMGRIVPI